MEIGRPPMPESVDNNGLYTRQNVIIREMAQKRGLSAAYILRQIVDEFLAKFENNGLEIDILNPMNKE